MRRLFLFLALACCLRAARADEVEPAKPLPVSAEQPKPAPAMATLPPVAAAPGAYVAPGSLPPVSAQLFHIGGKLEIQPLVMLSVGDPFWRTVGLGFRAEHHFDERWSVSGHVAGALSLLAAPIQLCGGAACSAPDAERLRSTPGKLQMLLGAELGWAPIYGKLSLIGEHTLHFDAYISAGPELVREQIAPDASSAETGRWAGGARFSLGERLFVTDRITFRFAVSELVYAGRVRGKFEAERKLTLETGLTWFFGGR